LMFHFPIHVTRLLPQFSQSFYIVWTIFVNARRSARGTLKNNDGDRHTHPHANFYKSASDSG